MASPWTGSRYGLLALNVVMSDYSKIKPSIKRELETIKVIGNNPDDAVEVIKIVEPMLIIKFHRH